MAKIKERNKIEEYFHDDWAKKTDMEVVLPERYFTSPTSVECKYALLRMKPIKGKEVLDLGCGFGEASIWFALKGANVISLDISAKMLNCVKKLAKRYKVERKIRLVKSSAEKLPFENESIDLIFGGNILHHTDIKAVSEEIKRVLKPKGKAIFIEPLAYNTLINIYRKMAKDVRTKMEKPFTFRGIKTLTNGFSKASHKEFQLFTTLIFVWFFIGERLNPNKVRYWKRFIEKGEDYKKPFMVLKKIDDIFLKIPFLRRYCWNTVIELVK